VTNARAVLVGLVIVASLASVSYSGVIRSPGEVSFVQNYGIENSATDNSLAQVHSIMTVTTDKSYYLPGEPVNITATLNGPLALTCPTSLTMYFVIIDSYDRVIYDMSRHGYWLQVITTLVVRDQLVRSFIWNQVDDNGAPVGFPKCLQAEVIVPAWNMPLSAFAQFEINPMPTSFQIELFPGWNLVSSPLVNDSCWAGGIGLENGSVVAKWDPPTQSYLNMYIVGSSPERRDFRLVAGCSYFIWSPQDQTVILRGCSPNAFSQFSVNLDVPIYGGWICVGFSSLGPGWNASDIPALVKGAKVLVVCKWEPIYHVYKAYLPGSSPPSHDFVIGPGVGCWLWVDGPGTLTYSP